MKDENVKEASEALAAANDDQEIDLIEIAAKLWKERKKIIKWGIAGAVVGLIVAISIPREYTATVLLAPESSDSGSSASKLGGLAALAGVSAGSGSSDAVYPTLYPDVVSSIPFSVGLFDIPVVDKEDNPFTLQQFLDEETHGAWWGWILGLPGKMIGGILSIFRDSDEEGDGTINTFKLTRDQNEIRKSLEKRITADVDTKTGVITIECTMQDPMVAAIVADSVCSRLKTYVTNYRTDKARQDLEYYTLLCKEAQANYYAAQQSYAEYLDRNQNLAFHSAQTTRDRLANESQLAFSLYNQTAQQVQQAEARVQAVKPVFAVIQPASVPLRASKPRKLLILIGFTFLAAAIQCAWVVFGDEVRKFKEEAMG